MAVSSVTVHTSSALRQSEALWSQFQHAIEGRVAWKSVDEESGAVPLLPMLTSRGHSPWAFLESDFSYAPHRQICAEGGESRTIGTRFPLIFVFSEAAHAHEVAGAAQQICSWLRSPGSCFETSRPVLLSYGNRPSTLASIQKAREMLGGLICQGLDIVELKGEQEAVEYIAQCAAAVAESRKRRVPSRFKVAGLRCQTLRDPIDKLRISWVSQLMQIPGVSEEIAKVVAERYPSPASILSAVAKADSSDSANAIAERFVSEIEYPIRGKKSTRKIGPMVSRRIFMLFHPTVTPDYVLV